MFKIIALPVLTIIAVIIGLLVTSYGLRKNGNATMANEVEGYAEKLAENAVPIYFAFLKFVAIVAMCMIVGLIGIMLVEFH